jgi:hypothetical protein
MPSFPALPESEGFLFSGFALVSQSQNRSAKILAEHNGKISQLKTTRAALALAGFALAVNVHAITTNDIQLWTGSGTNHAALVIEWNSPEIFNNTTVPAPVATKTLVWGYQFNGTATATEMFNAVLASDHRLYAVVNNTYGTFVEGLGYNLSGDGVIGLSDGNATYSASAFVNGDLLNSNLDPDSAHPLNNGDLFWAGYFGPNWNVWNELGDDGGFSSSPDRGTNQYWNTVTGIQGQWEFAYSGLDAMPIQDGSWLGFSVAAAGYATNTADPATAAFNYDEQAPPSPDGTYVAYVCNTNDFAAQVVSSSGLASAYPYNDPTAILGRPTLLFVESELFESDVTNRTKIVEDPYNVAPDGSDVITKITNGGQVTLMMGRKVYHNPNNPYGVDLMVFGNSFFIVPGGSSSVDDSTDLDTTELAGSPNGYATKVSVSQDGTNWFTFPVTAGLFPDNAYRWDDANHSWTDEQLNPNKPLNPSIYGTSLIGQTAAYALDQFMGSAGGTGYNLQASGFSWIQYVRVQPGPGTYTVIDAIAAVNPVVEGDALSITPDNIASGMTNLFFQKPANTSQTLISVQFASVSETANISTVALSDFSSFAPVPGNVCSACQITAKPASGTTPVSLVANVALSTGDNYTGDGSDLRVMQWNGGSWNLQTFTFNPASNQVCLAGLTNLSALVVSRLSPQLSIQAGTNGFNLPLTPFANVTYTLQRSIDLLDWTAVTTITPTSQQPVMLQDPAPPASRAFYRVKVNP